MSGGSPTTFEPRKPEGFGASGSSVVFHTCSTRRPPCEMTAGDEWRDTETDSLLEQVSIDRLRTQVACYKRHIECGVDTLYAVVLRRELYVLRSGEVTAPYRTHIYAINYMCATCACIHLWHTFHTHTHTFLYTCLLRVAYCTEWAPDIDIDAARRAACCPLPASAAAAVRDACRQQRCTHLSGHCGGATDSRHQHTVATRPS